MTDLSKYRRALAEVAGINPRSFLGPGLPVNWLPDEDVAQAIRVLEAMRIVGFGVFIRGITEGEWRCKLLNFSTFFEETDVTLSRAICRAVIAALKLKGDGE